MSDHADNEIFSGAEAAFGFILERADSFFHLAPVSRAMADPRRTVYLMILLLLQSKTTLELCSGMDSVTFRILVSCGS